MKNRTCPAAEKQSTQVLRGKPAEFPMINDERINDSLFLVSCFWLLFPLLTVVVHVNYLSVLERLRRLPKHAQRTSCSKGKDLCKHNTT